MQSGTQATIDSCFRLLGTSCFRKSERSRACEPPIRPICMEDELPAFWGQLSSGHLMGEAIWTG